jgi:hypothetical protein
MLTRAKAGIYKPNPRYALSTAQTTPTPPSAAMSLLPSSLHAALRDPNWHAAMEHEFCALQSNRTWHLVDRPPGAHDISGKWVFKHKLNPDGSLERYKALCAGSCNALASILGNIHTRCQAGDHSDSAHHRSL